MSPRRFPGLMAVMMAGALSAGCGGGDDDASHDGGPDAQVTVLSAFYPLAELVGTIGGDRVESVNLTPAGVEPHDLELTSDEIEDIEGADAVFYLGRDFMPALERALRRAEGQRVDLLEGLPLERSSDGGDGDLDPHVWLDPALMVEMAAQVAETLAAVDPGGQDGYGRRRDALVAELEVLNAEYRDTLVDCQRNVFVTSHHAFGYLARRYGLEEQAVSGLAPETEPDPERIAELSDLIRRLGVPVVFAETLLPKKLADALAREADVRVETLNPIEGLTDQELAAGADYLSTMRDNLAKLDGALDCAGGPGSPPPS